jgi:OOP family OmpA-OmpF porin
MGSKAYNENLSERRALSVKEYLAERGVDARKIQTHGPGEADPVTLPGACEGLDRSKTIQCLAPDRRVELEVIGARQR